MIIQPTEPTPWAKMLGIEKLGHYDPEKKVYSLTIIPHPDALNFFKTTHGGYLAGVFDDAFGMLAYFLYGVNSATTIRQEVEPLKMLRLDSKNPLDFEIIFKAESNSVIYMAGFAKRSGVIVAKAKSEWRLRKKRSKQ